MSHKAPVLEKPHAEVAILHRAAFSKWAGSVCLPSTHYIDISLTSPFYHSLSVCLFVLLSLWLFLSSPPFSSLPWFTLPPTLAHMHPHTQTSSIAIPERSRLVWQWVGLCPWTQWHPRYRCIKPNWHYRRQVATPKCRKKQLSEWTQCMHVCTCNGSLLSHTKTCI